MPTIVRSEMKYLIVALINGIYGVMTLLLLSRDTPGYYLILSISLVLTVLGLTGVFLYFRMLYLESRERGEDTFIKGWFQFAKNIDIVLIVGLLFRAFVLQPYIVDGNSMEQNFHNNQYLLVDQITYRFRAPKLGEAIVFHPPVNPDTNYIKRIIALPGETVTIANNTVSVNGQILAENYIYPGSKTTIIQPSLSETLGPDEYFVMGDNREHSSDSREWGAVPKKNIVGRAWLIVYPVKDFGIVKDPITSIPELSSILRNLSPPPIVTLANLISVG